MRFRQLIEQEEDQGDVPSDGLVFTKKNPKRVIVTHDQDGLPLFDIKKSDDGYWYAHTPEGSLVIPPQRSPQAITQAVKQFYDDREEMDIHPNYGKADEIAQHLFSVLKSAGPKHGGKAVQKAFQEIVDRDQPMRWEIAVIKDKFLALANPPITEATFKSLDKNKVALTADERAKVNAADLESTIWKSVDPKSGKTTYITHTHRASATAPTLKGAISNAKNHIDATG